MMHSEWNVKHEEGINTKTKRCPASQGSSRLCLLHGQSIWRTNGGFAQSAFWGLGSLEGMEGDLAIQGSLAIHRRGESRLRCRASKAYESLRLPLADRKSTRLNSS